MPKKQQESDMDNPEEHFAWAFASGIPDPRGKEYGYQPLIPPPCLAGLSQMLWDFGFRHQPELQTRWVPEYKGGDRNFVALGVTDVDPQEVVVQATEMLVSEFPEIAAKLAAITPENQDMIVHDQAVALLSSLEQLKAAQEQLDQQRRGELS